MHQQTEQNHHLVAVDYMRAWTVLTVVAVHAWIAYNTRLPKTATFGDPNGTWKIVPVVDDQRWMGANLIFGFVDTWAMPLMFLLSGLFAWRSLLRRGDAGFLIERLKRIGLPMLITVALMPLAYGPAYLQKAAAPSLSSFAHAWWSSGVWPAGPEWFLGVLLAFNVLAAVLRRRVEPAVRASGGLMTKLASKPVLALAATLAVSAAVYLPLAFLFPWTSKWVNYGPFMFQPNRLGYYLLYFCVGMLLGSIRASDGLLNLDGKLARMWLIFFICMLLAFALMIYLQTGGVIAGSVVRRRAAAVCYVVTGCIGAFFVMAACTRLARYRFAVLRSLGGHSYGIYLMHYFFVTWIQLALLKVAIGGFAKGLIVFTATVAACWMLSLAYESIIAKWRRAKQLPGMEAECTGT